MRWGASWLQGILGGSPGRRRASAPSAWQSCGCLPADCRATFSGIFLHSHYVNTEELKIQTFQASPALLLESEHLLKPENTHTKKQGQVWVTSTLLLFVSADLVEDGITDTEDVHDNGVFQQGKEVVGHSLPEMQQEVLDLEQQQFDKVSKSECAGTSAAAEAVTSSKFTLMALSRMHWQ